MSRRSGRISPGPSPWIGRPSQITSPEVGAEYRRAILEPNGAKTGDEMFHDFVGREPSTEAWLHYKGFSPPPD